MSVANIRMESEIRESVVTPVKSATKSRLHYIDNLRILMTILVILTHLAIGYGAPGDWYYNEAGEMSAVSTILMTLMVVINQAFFMGFFFLLSSYFMPGSLERKGTSAFLSDRLKRLGIPILFFALIINPLIHYWHQAFAFGFAGTLWQYLSEAGIQSAGFGPMWFVETLLIFSFIYALVRRLAKYYSFSLDGRDFAPSNKVIAGFALTLGLLSFFVRIWLPVGYWFEPLHLQLAHFPQYIGLFIVGILAYRFNWMAKISDAQGKRWLWIVLILALILFPIVFIAGGGLQGDLTPFLGGVHWQSLVYAVWEQFLALSLIVVLTVGFRNWINTQGKVSKAMSGAAYTVYILHTPLIIATALLFSTVKLDLGLKFALVAPVAVVVCFITGYFVKKLPFARGIL